MPHSMRFYVSLRNVAFNLKESARIVMPLDDQTEKSMTKLDASCNYASYCRP